VHLLVTYLDAWLQLVRWIELVHMKYCICSLIATLLFTCWTEWTFVVSEKRTKKSVKLMRWLGVTSGIHRGSSRVMLEWWVSVCVGVDLSSTRNSEWIGMNDKSESTVKLLWGRFLINAWFTWIPLKVFLQLNLWLFNPRCAHNSYEIAVLPPSVLICGIVSNQLDMSFNCFTTIKTFLFR